MRIFAASVYQQKLRKFVVQLVWGFVHGGRFGIDIESQQIL